MNTNSSKIKFMNLVMLTTPQSCNRLPHPLFVMASNIVQSLKGYDHQFVDPPTGDLLCLICLSVARNPHQINCCGKILCRACLDEHRRYSNDFPQCRKDINSFADKRSKFKTCIVYSTIIIILIHVEEETFGLIDLDNCNIHDNVHYNNYCGN